MYEEIPDLNLFMVCEVPKKEAFACLPEGYYFDSCRRDELDLWKRMPFDEEEQAEAFFGYMTDYFQKVYGEKEDLFYSQCLFVRDSEGNPVGTGFIWKSYGKINTLHWLKVKKGCEGSGIGRALITKLLSELGENDFPVYLHTQPSSNRAIKLYTDFGFAFLTDKRIGYRENGLEESLPVLMRYMPEEDYKRLRFRSAPEGFLEAVLSSEINEF